MNESLPIVIDVSAIPVQPGGVGTYARELLRCLPAAGIEPVVLTRRNDERVWDGVHRTLRLVPSARPLRLAWEQILLTSATSRSLGDAILPKVLHSPHYTMPRLVGRRWRPARVVTIHDLTFFTRPQDHSRSKVVLFRHAIERAVRESDATIAVSHATAEQLERFLPKGSPVHVIPHGIDHDRFHPCTGKGDETSDLEILAPLGIPESYILHLGTIEPRKNVAGLLKAYEEVIRRWHRSDEPPALVLAGGAWPGTWEHLERTATDIGNRFPQARVIRCGTVGDEALAPLYRRAGAVLYPSFEEGFGLPFLEALACGALVVTSKQTVMHSIAGDAAISVDPSDPLSIAQGIEVALEEFGGPRIQGFLNRSALAIAVAAPYRWSRTAQAHADVYRSLC